MRSRPLRWSIGGATFALALALSSMVATPANATSAHHPAPSHVSHSSYGDPHMTVLASGLNQPKKLSIGPNGDVIVAESGDGVIPSSCTDGNEVSCLDMSSSIASISPWGNVRTLVGDLPSVGAPGDPTAESTGVAQARYVNGKLYALFQNTNIDATTGEQQYGPGGALLGDLVAFSKHHPSATNAKVLAQFGPFEAANNPDNGEGTAVAVGQEAAIDSDPYAFVPWHGGFAVADAAGNDLLFVKNGKISVLAVFPTITEIAPPGTLGPTQTTPVPVEAQPVPDSVAVGPDGALYIGQLGGFPFGVGQQSVFRYSKQSGLKTYATGFTAIGDVAFDHSGNLLVLEIDQIGLNDPSTGLPTPGALIKVDRWSKHQTTLLTDGLEFPTGMAVGNHGEIYISNYGVLPATGGPFGLSGQVVKVTFKRGCM
jgi:hypothetical protein